MPTAWQPVVDLAAKFVDRGLVPSCQLAIARHGHLEVFEALGEATTASRFPAYSATKPIVASAIWQLIGEGWLDVSSKVGALAPKLHGPGMEQVTMEQVLLHTSGFPNAPMDPVEGADTERRRRRFSTWHTEWEPGSRFTYHPTSAHWVMADMLERADGADFREVVERRVTEPLGLPHLLGIPENEQGDIVLPVDSVGFQDPARFLANPAALASGVPGRCGGVMTAADLTLFYQGLLSNPGRLWAPGVLADVTSNVRCTFEDPLMKVPANRTLGLVLAGDDGWHVFRYACFGSGNSPASFGHAGAHGQVGWADPVSGISFAYLHNAVHPDMRKAGARAVSLSSLVCERGVPS